MMKLLLSICVLLYLLVSAGCTSAPQQPTPVIIESRPKCALIPCQLPARPALQSNDDWRRAVDQLEDDLLSCAVQVQGCIELQKQNNLK